MVVGIAGLGVIGGSIGLALRSANHARVIGYDVDLSVVEEATKLGCLDERSVNVEGLAIADLIFLAVPPHAMRTCLDRLEPHIRPSMIVSDCSSVKGFIENWVKRKPSRSEWFIGGHPMAGNEGSGPSSADTTLFAGSKWILTPYDSTPLPLLNRLEVFIRDFGSEPVRMTSEEHDRHVALLSHLPHAIAANLIQMAGSLESPDIAAGSWRDLTRVAGSNPALWQHIFLENRVAITKTIDQFLLRLTEMRDVISQGDGEALRGIFDGACSAKRKREGVE
jgi:prephenate dehydrogenase